MPTDASSMQHVVDLKVARLEHIFSPRGLPLVRKDPGSDHVSLTILVRGQAGGGKTTLAAALAHAIARQSGGVALYLSTEALAAELRFKTRFLDLDEDMVRGWKRRSTAPPGAILTQHVELTAPGQTATSAGSRRIAALRAVDAMLDESTESTEPTSPPVRVVVLDGFTLPDASPEPPDLRHELVAFLQDLEARGITPMIVEEAGETGFEWLPFIVDLVFEVGLDRDPDTGKLIRRLRCPKSRYAVCRPGPHDYGLENGRLALWPDPLEVLAADSTAVPPAPTPPPDFFWPDTTEDRYYILSGPGVVASYYDDPTANILRPLLRTGGAIALKVICGAETRIERDGVIVARVGESDGPYALAWAVLEHGRYCNLISIGQMPGLMRRSRFRLPLLHMLEALARAGKRVCVHGSSHDLSSTDNLGTVLLPLRRHPTRVRHTMPRQELLPITRWLDPPPYQATIKPASTKDFRGVSLLEQARQELQNPNPLPESHLDFLTWQGDDVLSISLRPGQVGLYLTREDAIPATLASAALLCLELHRIGEIDLAQDSLRHVRRWATKTVDRALFIHLASIYALLGQPWHAAELIAPLMMTDNVHLPETAIWAGLHAVHAPSKANVDVLRSMIGDLPPNGANAVLGFAVRAMVEVSGPKNAGDWLVRNMTSFTRNKLYFYERLLAEACLSSSGLGWQTHGLDILKSIEHANLSVEFHNELLYNIGVAASRPLDPDPEQAHWAFATALKKPSLLAADIRSRILSLPPPYNLIDA